MPRPSGPNLVQVNLDFRLQLPDTAKMRTAEPPPKYDDKGNLKKYTPEELKALRADSPELPGFPSDLTEVKNGQTVIVYFARQPVVPTEPQKGTSSGSASTEGRSPPPAKPMKLSIPTPVGALAGTIAGAEESTKKFTLKVDTVGVSGQKVDTAALVKDLHVVLVVVLKE